MTPLIILAILGAAVITAVIVSFRRRAGRRRRLMRHPLSWSDTRLFRRVALTAWLPRELKRELIGQVQVLLDEKGFEGADGLAVTREMQITVATLAGLLLLRKDFDFYPQLRHIILYPAVYVAKGNHGAFAGAVIVGASARLGESWQSGEVVLAWKEARREARDMHSRRNVILHEFAHQIDQLDGAADGVPPLPGGDARRAWRTTLRREYDRLCDEEHHAVRGVIDWYGATNPAEFFAVTTESFFCEPLQLRRAHPELYRQFADFYRLDPAEWRKRAW